MDSKITINGKETIIAFEGRIDTTNAGDVENIIKEQIKEGVTLILDFEKLEYISSAGLRVLLSSHKQLLSVKGSLIIRNVNGDVMEVLDITGFSSILRIED